MEIITRHYCAECGKEIQNTWERRKLYEHYKIREDLCARCLNMQSWEKK